MNNIELFKKSKCKVSSVGNLLSCNLSFLFFSFHMLREQLIQKFTQLFLCKTNMPGQVYSEKVISAELVANKSMLI